LADAYTRRSIGYSLVRMSNCPWIGSNVHPNQIPAWKAQLVEAAAGVFGSSWPSDKQTTPTVDLKDLRAKIGELTVENDFLAGALGKADLLSAKR
jgi:transposase